MGQKKQAEIRSFLKTVNLETFLASKPLFYAEIDYTRMPKVWKSIEHHFTLPKIIHLIGTNGKGSTGRFLAHYLHKNGFLVGHYSSPHILRFNERIWINGENVDDSRLSHYHDKLYGLLSSRDREALSFFEYTTLLAMAIFHACDYVILEAGLGGEHDATAVFDNMLTLVTPIALDHQDFLGDCIADISKTKLNAIQKRAIIARQREDIVYAVAEEISTLNKVEIFKSESFFSDDELKEMEKFLKNREFPLFLKTNLALALSAIKYLGLEISYDNLSDITLFGRCQKISKNVTIDVGHNALAASALVETFREDKIHLIFNSFADKDYERTLKILKPAIKIIEIIPILNERIEKKENLIKVIEKLDIPYKDFVALEDSHEYLVFGSFSVVEVFLKKYGKRTKFKIST